MDMNAIIDALSQAKDALEQAELAVAKTAGQGAPDPSPAHETAESPAMEALEHKTGAELQDEKDEDEE